jgi:hypothetical protein
MIEKGCVALSDADWCRYLAGKCGRDEANS